MRIVYTMLFVVCSGWFSLPVSADESCHAANCVEEQQLSVSLALGYGQRSNPLLDGEELPLVLLPDIYYYSRYWFFDNGKIGTSWSLSDTFHLSLIGQLNPEKGYFQKWFSSNFTVLRSSEAMTQGQGESPYRAGMEKVSIYDVRKRPTAFDAGLQLDWYLNDWQLQALLWTDVSKTYHGQHASAAALYNITTDFANWQLSARLYWKSAKLIDAYYGIDAEELFYLERYQGRDSWQPEVRLNWSKALTERTGLLAFVRHQWLDDAMTDSPLVRKNHITTWFLGISYRFY